MQTYQVVGVAFRFSMQCDWAGLQRRTEARGLLIDWSTSDGVASGLESALLLQRLQVWQWAMPEA